MMKTKAQSPNPDAAAQFRLVSVSEFITYSGGQKKKIKNTHTNSMVAIADVYLDIS